MADLFVNPVKPRLKNREKLAVSWVQTNSPIACEIMAQQGFDILCIDMEHSPVDFSSLVSLLQAMQGYGPVPFVRAPWNDLVTLKRILDCGTLGLHIPYVNTAEEARAAMQACKYPPIGNRGCAGSPRANGFGSGNGDYLKRINDEVVVMVAMETPEAAQNIEQIIQVDGVDGIFIGPTDLSVTMGHFCNPGHPEVQACIREMEEKVLKGSDKFLGTVATSMAQAKELYDRGYSYVAFTGDASAMRTMAAQQMKEFREITGRA